MTVVATRAIENGEPVTVSYGPLASKVTVLLVSWPCLSYSYKHSYKAPVDCFVCVFSKRWRGSGTFPPIFEVGARRCVTTRQLYDIHVCNGS